MENNVTVYTKDMCGKCKMSKSFLDKHGVAFEEINVSHDEEGLNKIKEDGFNSLPVIYNEGEEPFTGFQPDKLKKAVK